MSPALLLDESKPHSQSCSIKVEIFKQQKMWHIFHTSDIHIRRGSYADIEYAWARLVKYIKTVQGNRILCIAGDVFEHKVNFSPEDISCFIRLMDSIPLECYIIIIPGNHDFSAGSEDMITPVRRAAERRNGIYYYPKSGVYTIPDCPFEFHVFSPIDKLNPSSNSQKFKIALVHEQIGTHRTVQDFNMYDLVLAGDDHGLKYLAPNFAYCGSLTQKTISEPVEHGIIHWKVNLDPTRFVRSEFVPLKQKRVALRLEICENSEPEIPPGEFEEVRRITLIHRQCDPDHVNRVMRSLRERYRCEVREVSESRSIRRPIRETDSVRELEQCLMEMGVPEAKRAEIARIHNENMRTETRLKWQLISLQWDDFMCYGKNNKIDFCCLDGVNALLAPNGWGKSAIIDVLCFALYGKTMRGSVSEIKRQSVDAPYARVRCVFRSGSVYTVTRHRVQKDLTDTLECGDSVITGTRAVDAAIQSLIGTMEQFLTVCVATQDRDFRADYARQFEAYLGLDALDTIYNQLRKKIRENRAVLKSMILEQPAGEFLAVETELQKTKEELDMLQAQAKRISEALNLAHVDLGRINSNRDAATIEAELATLPATDAPVEVNFADPAPYKAELAALPKIEIDIPAAKARIQELAAYDTRRTEFTEAQCADAQPAPSLPSVIRKTNLSFEQLQTELKSIQDAEAGLNTAVALSRLSRDAGALIKYNASCPACQSNKQTLSGARPFADVREEFLRHKQRKETLQNDLLWFQTQEANRYHDKLYWERQNLINRLRIATRARKLAEVIAACEASRRPMLEAELRHVKAKARIAQLRDRETVVSQRIRTLQSQLASLSANLQEWKAYNAQLEKKRQYEAETKDLEIYRDALDPRTGVPSRILERFCGTLQTSINDVLTATTNFRVRVNPTTIKNNRERGLTLSVILQNGTEVSTETLSGSQKFITDWAVRLSLIKDHAYMPSVLIVDEGFGALDPEHLRAMKAFLINLSHQTFYEWIIIISHIDELQVDDDISIISINRHNGVSSIRVEKESNTAQPAVQQPIKGQSTVTCACGATLRVTSLASHTRSAKHRKAMEKKARG